MKKVLFTILILVYHIGAFCQPITSHTIDQQITKSIHLVEDGKYQEGLNILAKLNEYNVQEFTNRQLGLIYFYMAEANFNLNNKSTSTLYYAKAIPSFKLTDDTSLLATCYYNLSYQQLINGKYEASLLNNNLANEAYLSTKDTIGIIKTTTWTSIIFHDTQDYKLGIEYGIKAHEIASKYNSGNADLKARALNAIAINYDDNGDYEMAIAYHKKVIDLKYQLSDTLKLARTYNNIGNSLMKKGDYKKADYYFRKNLALNKLENNQYGLATVYTNLGTIAYLNKNWKEAKSYLSQAEDISYRIKDVEKIQDVLFQQYKYYEAHSKLTTALNYLTNYYQLKDSLLNIDKINALQKLETKYKTKEKETEIKQQQLVITNQGLLLQKNTILILALIVLVLLLLLVGFLIKARLTKKQQLALQQKEIEYKEAQLNAIIATQEKERTRFATDLHDSFGQTISVLKMNIETAQKEFSASKKSDLLYSESQNMLNNMYDELRGVCFNLMPTTLIKMGLVDAVSEFSHRVNMAGKIKVEVINYGLKNRLQELPEIAIYRIIQEWVNNILKYNNATLVTIQFTTDDAELTLTIEDNGTGFNTNDLEHSNGHGWKNINARAKLIGGTLDIDSTVGQKGSILILNTPLNYS